MNDKFGLDIPVLLLEAPDATDACIGRLVSTLGVKPGVERAHILSADSHAAKALHPFRRQGAAPSPQARVGAGGAEISERYIHAAWEVEGMISAITRRLCRRREGMSASTRHGQPHARGQCRCDQEVAGEEWCRNGGAAKDRI